MNEAGAWTDERVELLKKLWSDGLSASQIAAELGSVTRNAVIGKVHRLGLSGRAKSAAAPAAPRNAAPRKQPPRAPSHPMAAPAQTRGANALAPDFEAEPETDVRAVPQVSEDVVIPFSERVTIMDLREYMCRWPMGDPTTAEFRFCGARSQTGLPYCTHHARIAYQPAADRRRDRSKARA
ncbi:MULTISPECIES: GcrA family cell cycle regulator [unclassified Bosea (in: a-proteobacteria)]|uniref:GcrA family cell cycle regulator n=1 Tax=unclassified Bosea (in: a-proteobacteria) TaxID=2653178 RepID=UPI000954EDF9|nr:MULTISPECIES: GcrA family cell cycle regulator [unclassified Bosea (in: a-proteobacteria)]TAJ30326.1 MAG: GcrA cell cycle regulator [Bosea sp. (in: a-proteobacteria)]SIQ97775.1 GcrA cell cycle regulator [Bosea sp. TND4EK4]